MKITYISDSPIPADAASCMQMLHMVDALRSLGHHVRLLAPFHRNMVWKDQEKESLQHHFGLSEHFSCTYLPYVSIAGRLRGSYFPVSAFAAKISNSDLVYTRSTRIANYATRLGAQTILEIHNPPNGAYDRKACAWLASHHKPHRWVFISAKLREIMQARYPIENDFSIVEHDAVDMTRFSVALTRDEARRRLGLPQDGILVVHSGHLYAGRGAELLLDVAAKMKHVSFLFVGGRSQDVERLQMQCKLSNVIFVGHKPSSEVPNYLFAADILAMPYTSDCVTSDGKTRSIEYASPMKLFEYMAAGRAIVSSRFPSLSEVLVDGANSRLVEPNSADTLHAAIEELASSEVLRNSLGARAKEDVHVYTWRGRAMRILSHANCELA